MCKTLYMTDVFHVQVSTCFLGLSYSHTDSGDGHWQGGDSSGRHHSWYGHYRRRFGQGDLGLGLSLDGACTRDTCLTREHERDISFMKLLHATYTVFDMIAFLAKCDYIAFK